LADIGAMARSSPGAALQTDKNLTVDLQLVAGNSAAWIVVGAADSSAANSLIRMYGSSSPQSKNSMNALGFKMERASLVTRDIPQERANSASLVSFL
jgi:hypothetical protein